MPLAIFRNVTVSGKADSVFAKRRAVAGVCLGLLASALAIGLVYAIAGLLREDLSAWGSALALLIFGAPTSTLVYLILQQIKTTITIDGVTQWSIRGSRNIQWHTAPRVALTPPSRLDIRGASSRITVVLSMYEQPERVVNFVQERLGATTEAGPRVETRG
jgi:ABC-type uncharacterized transport system permease subunit